MSKGDRCERCGQSRAEVRLGRGRHGGTVPCFDPNNHLVPSSEHARWFTDAYNRRVGGDARHHWSASARPRAVEGAEDANS